MRINAIRHESVAKAQDFLLKKLCREVFVFDSYVFPNIMTPRTKVDLSFLCTPQDFVVDAVKNAKLVSNTFLCVLITIWNKADELIKRLGLNNTEAARLVCVAARISKCGWSKFQPCRGKLVLTCLDELINAFCRGGLNPWLFEAVRTYSLRIEKRHANT